MIFAFTSTIRILFPLLSIALFSGDKMTFRFLVVFFLMTLISQAQVTAPVNLVSFTSAVLPQGVLLRWQTTEEVDNTGFEIQRRAGDGSWEAVDFVSAAGTANGGSYTWLDHDLSHIAGDARLSYRLRQIDYSGKDWVSQDITVERDGALPETPGITVTPHPARMTAVLHVTGVDPTSAWTLQVTDLFGRTMHKRHLENLETTGDLSVDVQQYSAGVYTVILSNGQQTIWKNMVVRNN
ncbi:MAG: T9SS type A sorting domain-containing protein [Bacteroidetes bacterium]|nr:T9SS type A sorting domain-containing protein [Bacteroidota bacterium]